MAETERVDRRSLAALAIAVVFVSLLTAATRLVWDSAFGERSHPFIDLDYYRTALAAVHAGLPLFEFLGYPPFALVVLSPLGWLPEEIGNVAWSVVTLGVGVGLAALLKRLAQESGRDDLEGTGRIGFVAGTAFAATLMVLSFPFVNHLQCGQLSIFVLALVFVDASGFMPRRAQGALVGVAAALKLTPLIFLPYYVLTGQRRQAVMAMGTFLAATSVGFLLYPADSWRFWSRIGSTGRFGELGRPDNLSMMGTVSRWVPGEESRMTVWLTLAAIVGTAAMLNAWRHYRRTEVVEAMLVLGTASVAMSPVSWPHHQLWLVLIAAWLIWAPTLRDRMLGLALYLPFVFAFAAVIGDSRFDAELWIRIAAEIPALIPVLIAVLGLPGRTKYGSGFEVGSSARELPPALPPGALT